MGKNKHVSEAAGNLHGSKRWLHNRERAWQSISDAAIQHEIADQETVIEAIATLAAVTRAHQEALESLLKSIDPTYEHFLARVN
jgi:hypothetical protein